MASFHNAASTTAHKASRSVPVINHTTSQYKRSGEIFTGLMYKLLLHFTVISNVYRSFIPNRTIITNYCLAHWISKLPASFEIHWVRKYLVNFTCLAGGVNASLCKTKPIFTGLGHGKLLWFLALTSYSTQEIWNWITSLGKSNYPYVWYKS